MINFKSNISSADNSNYFVTSDLHFGHAKILEYQKETRPFASVDQMTSILIEHWNKTVSTNDVVFHLGDFSFMGAEKTKQVINQLNGNIVFVLGNHDVKVFSQIENRGEVKLNTHHYLEINFEGVKVCMMHYPIAAWNRQGRGSVMLHGHTHQSYQGLGRTVDVGFDNWGKIIPLKTAVDFCLQREIYCPDKHHIVKE